MPNKVRIFVSSTMDDLSNERQAVVEQISELNLEPVNAEGLLPNGSSSWRVLEKEITSAHIFVLILGSRYGWTPEAGYGAGSGKSVTHLEFDLARAKSIPILPFFKQLKYGTDSITEDSIRRDRFRTEVESWDTGLFRAEFDLARDLGYKVRQCLLDILQTKYLGLDVQEPPRPARGNDLIPGEAPRHYTDSVLFAGAGMSSVAGLPTAAILAEVVSQQLAVSLKSANAGEGHSLAEVVELAEAQLGREAVRDAMAKTVVEMMSLPFALTPTRSHVTAVNAFSNIITTNYDLLFEKACELHGIDYTSSCPGSWNYKEGSAVNIYKIHGSVDRPGKIIITDDDIKSSYATDGFWVEINKLLSTRSLAIIGIPIRDSVCTEILFRRNSQLPSVYVASGLTDLDRAACKRHGVTPIESEIGAYMDRIRSDLFRRADMF